MPNIVFIADTHLQHQFALPPGDILVHAGDLTGRGAFSEVCKALNWLSSLPYAHIVFIAGNHDFLFERDPNQARMLVSELPPHVHYLQDSSVTIEGLKFWGSPYTPLFFNWAFNLDPATNDLQEKWAKIPEDTDIVITHGPAFNILDKTPDHFDRPGKNVGCRDLRERLRVIKPKVHVSGHIHCGYGLQTTEGTTYINASICNEQYKAVNKPISLFLE